MKKNFDWNKPITWKGYAKLCGISFIAGLIIAAIDILLTNIKRSKLNKDIGNDLDDLMKEKEDFDERTKYRA